MRDKLTLRLTGESESRPVDEGVSPSVKAARAKFALLSRQAKQAEGNHPQRTQLRHIESKHGTVLVSEKPKRPKPKGPEKAIVIDVAPVTQPVAPPDPKSIHGIISEIAVKDENQIPGDLPETTEASEVADPSKDMIKAPAKAPAAKRAPRRTARPKASPSAEPVAAPPPTPPVKAAKTKSAAKPTSKPKRPKAPKVAAKADAAPTVAIVPAVVAKGKSTRDPAKVKTPSQGKPKVRRAPKVAAEKAAPTSVPAILESNPAAAQPGPALQPAAVDLNPVWQAGQGLSGKIELTLVRYRHEMAQGKPCWITIISEDGSAHEVKLSAMHLFAAKLTSLAMQHNARLVIIGMTSETVIMHIFEGVLTVAREPAD